MSALRPASFVSGLVALLVAPGSASAYTLEGFAWSGDAPTTAPLQVHSTGWPAEAGSVQDVDDAVAAAVDTWNEEGQANIQVVLGEATEHDTASGDHVNAIGFRSGQGTNDALAQSDWLLTGEGTEIIECDIGFYGVNTHGPIDWSTDLGATPGDAYDLVHVVTHEMGHCLGLDHSEFPDAIMYPSTMPGVATRDLACDDMAGLQALYGVMGDEADCSDEAGAYGPPSLAEALGCNATGASPQIGALLLGALAAWGRRRAGRRA